MNNRQASGELNEVVAIKTRRKNELIYFLKKEWGSKYGYKEKM